jgi:hypothetical protein
VLVAFNLKAQNFKSFPVQTDTFSLGIGAGFDYGGFGGNILYYPDKNFGLFAGAGYAIAGVGFNAGIKYRLVSKKETAKVFPFAMAMYGYNAAIGVSDAKQYNKLFYGTTIGFGLDYRSNPMSSGYWSLALLIPFRSVKVNAYIDDLKYSHGIEFKNSLTPVTISIGYRIIIN